MLLLALLLVLRNRNDTDGNKLVIFSGIASYYGDNYIANVTNYILYKLYTIELAISAIIGITLEMSQEIIVPL